MKKFFISYYNYLNFFKKNKSNKEISKLSDLVKILNNNKNNEHENELNKNFIENKINDYNYSNIYIRNTEMQNIDTKESPSPKKDTNFLNVNNNPQNEGIFSPNFKFSEDFSKDFPNKSKNLNKKETNFTNRNSNKINFNFCKTFDKFPFDVNANKSEEIDKYFTLKNYRNTKSDFFDLRKSISGNFNSTDEINSYDYLSSHLEFSENIYRMIAIKNILIEDKKYEKDFKYQTKFASKLPWREKYYKYETEFIEYTQNNLPDWNKIKLDKRFENFRVRISSYMPLVFHHIRIIDEISIDKVIIGLDAMKNLENMKNFKLSGGRSDNPIVVTWNKHFILKTISKQEKITLDKMIKEYQIRLRDTKTFICRIYGLYRIKVGDQFDSYVILMRNMIDLPLENRYFLFDLKGSSVNRSTLKEQQKAFYANGFKDKINDKDNLTILKDNDFNFLKLNFFLSQKDAKNFILSIENDAQFLSNYNLTDYSLLVSVNKFDKDDYLKNFNCRVMKSFDNKYLFNFAIIDFLTVKFFNFFIIFSYMISRNLGKS